MVTALGAAAIYFGQAFHGILQTISGTVKRCPTCMECFVSEKHIFLMHMITCGKTEPVALYSFRQIDDEANRIKKLLEKSWNQGERVYVGLIADRVLREPEPSGRCPDPC